MIEKDIREEMSFWLSMAMDAKERGDETTAQYAAKQYRLQSEALQAHWRDMNAG